MEGAGVNIKMEKGDKNSNNDMDKYVKADGKAPFGRSEARGTGMLMKGTEAGGLELGEDDEDDLGSNIDGAAGLPLETEEANIID